MDENYLDNLLNEFSLDKELDQKLEDELDNQMQAEKQQKIKEESMSSSDIFNANLAKDVNTVSDVDDLKLSETQINELDHLDHLADLDMGNLDFSDIDFDDVDVTKTDTGEGVDFNQLLKEFEGDLKIGDFFDDTSKNSAVEENTSGEASANSNETFNADQFLDDLVQAEQQNAGNEGNNISEQTNESNPAFQENVPVQETVNQSENYIADEMADPNESLDDLFSMLDMENQASNQAASGNTQEGLDTVNGESKQDAVSQKEKKSFVQVLFGDPDEDDELTPEEIEQLEKKKAEKKAKKASKKAEKKDKAKAAETEKKAKKGKKKQLDEEKKRVKAQKKEKRRAEELANAEPESKLNKAAVGLIFSVILGGTFLLYVSTNSMNYTQAIEKATTYFSKQKYRNAYDQIVGVEIKEKDENLKERIYTVMYVERLYESYENNLELEREEKALDSLLRGVDKYYEHYSEAEELGIVEDLNNSFAKIQTALLSRYGISVDEAKRINGLENYEYAQEVNHYIENVIQ